MALPAERSELLSSCTPHCHISHVPPGERALTLAAHEVITYSVKPAVSAGIGVSRRQLDDADVLKCLRNDLTGEQECFYEPPPSTSGPSKGALIGGIVGAVIVGILLLLCVGFCCQWFLDEAAKNDPEPVR